MTRQPGSLSRRLGSLDRLCSFSRSLHSDLPLIATLWTRQLRNSSPGRIAAVAFAREQRCDGLLGEWPLPQCTSSAAPCSAPRSARRLREFCRRRGDTELYPTSDVTTELHLPTRRAQLGEALARCERSRCAVTSRSLLRMRSSGSSHECERHG
ncbi:hypothetical protein MTO96_010994 [Rhipicephalus appendiculatus]